MVHQRKSRPLTKVGLAVHVLRPTRWQGCEKSLFDSSRACHPFGLQAPDRIASRHLRKTLRAPEVGHQQALDFAGRSGERGRVSAPSRPHSRKTPGADATGLANGRGESSLRRTLKGVAPVLQSDSLSGRPFERVQSPARTPRAPDDVQGLKGV